MGTSKGKGKQPNKLDFYFFNHERFLGFSFINSVIVVVAAAEVVAFVAVSHV